MRIRVCLCPIGCTGAEVGQLGAVDRPKVRPRHFSDELENGAEAEICGEICDSNIGRLLPQDR